MTTVNRLIVLIKTLCEAFRCRLSCLCGNKKSEHAKPQHEQKPAENDPPKTKPKHHKK